VEKKSRAILNHETETRNFVNDLEIVYPLKTKQTHRSMFHVGTRDFCHEGYSQNEATYPTHTVYLYLLGLIIY